MAAAKRKRGFSLVELVVVLAVFAVVSSLAVSTVSTVVQRAEDAAAVATLRSVSRALFAAMVFDPPEAITAEYLEGLNFDVMSSAEGVHASASPVAFTTGPSTAPMVVSWSEVAPLTVSLAMKIPSGRCATELVTARDGVDEEPADLAICAAGESYEHPPGGSSGGDGDDGGNDDGPGGGADDSSPDNPDDGNAGDDDLESGGDDNPGDGEGGASGGVPILWAASPVSSGGDMELSGSVLVRGGHAHVTGSVYAVGSVTLDGVMVGGDVTCAGGAPCGTGQASAQQMGSVVHSNEVVVGVPSARDMWNAYSQAATVGWLNYSDGFGPADWFDLCGDGTVRLPDGAEPCAGTVLAAAGTLTDWVGFEGWRFDSGASTWVSQQSYDAPYGPVPAWRNPSRPRVEAVFYVHGASARIEGSNGGAATVIAEATDAEGRTGNVDVRGGGEAFTPVLERFLFVADGDVRLRSSAPYHGWTVAGGRLDAGGNTTYFGALAAAGRSVGPHSLLGPGPAVTLAARVELTFE